MKSAKNYSAASLNDALPRLGLMLLCVAVFLSGCKSYGPIGTSSFDPTYSQTLEKNEQLLYSAQTELVDGTFMEGEQESRMTYIGVLLLTNERVMFARWNQIQQRYEPWIWTGYSYVAQVKMHNNILLQYIAIAVSDGSKYTFLLGKHSVDSANAILMENIEKSKKIPARADSSRTHGQVLPFTPVYANSKRQDPITFNMRGQFKLHSSRVPRFAQIQKHAGRVSSFIAERGCCRFVGFTTAACLLRA